MIVSCEIQLTEKEAAFVAALARGIKPTQAAVAAGMSGPRGTALLRRPHVQAAVKQITANLIYVLGRISAEAL
jgi:phage terminase small subunit